MELQSYQFRGRAVLDALKIKQQRGSWPAREEYRLPNDIEFACVGCT